MLRTHLLAAVCLRKDREGRPKHVRGFEPLPIALAQPARRQAGLPAVGTGGQGAGCRDGRVEAWGAETEGWGRG
eukprot:365756-Chlamydomonas_euryale.AAC.28